MTGGELQIELTPVGSVVPYNETMDAISQGILQGDITATVYFSGRSKAFAMLGDLISGYERPDQIGMFCYHGGGQELLQEAFDTYADGNVKVVGCGAIARKSFTSKVPIRGIEDLKGVKVRSPEGLAANGVRARRRLAGRPAVIRGLHLARQGRDRRRRLQLLHDGRERRPARDRQVTRSIPASTRCR